MGYYLFIKTCLFTKNFPTPNMQDLKSTIHVPRQDFFFTVLRLRFASSPTRVCFTLQVIFKSKVWFTLKIFQHPICKIWSPLSMFQDKIFFYIFEITIHFKFYTSMVNPSSTFYFLFVIKLINILITYTI